MLKNYDDPMTEFEGEMEPEAIIDYFRKKAVPVLGVFTENMADTVFRDGKNALFAFGTPEQFEPIKKGLYDLSIKNKENLIFSTSGVKGGIQERLADFIGVKAEDTPVIYILSDTRAKPNK